VSINSDYLLSLREIYGADIAYILTGEKSDTAGTPSHLVQEPRTNYDPEEFVAVPFYPDVYASGGQGLTAENEHSIDITFRRYFFNNTVHTSPAGCFMLRISGDSMHPLYTDGSDLLIDRSRNKPREGPGFIVRIEDTLYCKLLRPEPGGYIRVHSVNSDYESFLVRLGQPGFEIIGEVIWWAQKSKYI